MTTAIAMVGFRNAHDVVPCLEALTHSTDPAFAVHVCENGGPAAAADLIDAVATIAEPDGAVGDDTPTDLVWSGRLRPGGQPVRILCPGGNLGYAGGVNRAIVDSRATPGRDGVWVLNPDTEPEPDALAALRAHAAGGPHGPYGIVGCRLVLRATGRVQLYGGRWRKWLARGYNIGLHAPADVRPDVAAVEAAMTYVNGASMFVSEAFLADAGLMDDRYFLYNEEVDWCFRGRAMGHRLGYAHDAVVIHAHGSTIGSNVVKRRRSPLAVYLDERNKLLFTRRFHPAIYPLVAVLTLGLTAQYLRHGALRNWLVALRGWAAGVRGEEGPPPMVRDLPAARVPSPGRKSHHHLRAGGDA